MDQALLVGPDIKAGEEAIQALEEAGIEINLALVAIFPQYDDWRLLISSPSLDQSHQTKAYERVAHALKGRFVETLPPMLILPTRNPIIRELRTRLTRHKNTEGKRISSQMVGHRLIENLYVYRVR